MNINGVPLVVSDEVPPIKTITFGSLDLYKTKTVITQKMLDDNGLTREDILAYVKQMQDDGQRVTVTTEPIPDEK